MNVLCCPDIKCIVKWGYINVNLIRNCILKENALLLKGLEHDLICQWKQKCSCDIFFFEDDNTDYFL